MINIHAFDSLPMGAILKDIGEQFLCIEPVQLLTDYYGNNNLKCGTKELIVILRSVHELALRICIDKMVDKHLMPVEQAEIVYKSVKQTPETAIDLLKAGGENGKNDILIKMDESKRRQFFSDMEGMSEDAIEQQLILLDSKITEKVTSEGDSNDTEEFLYQNKDSEKGVQARNWIEIRANYPKLYVNQLKNIVFPEAYVVCFSKNNNDSSMWANYADNHKGVCLIYDSDELEIRHKVDGISIKASAETKESFIKANIKPVTYGGDLVERNYFESLGELSIPNIEGWLTGNEKESSILNLYTNDEDQWRAEYWDAASAKTYRKLESWSHEEEYRLSLGNVLNMHGRPEDRIMEYNNKALKGVIFGINTSEYDMKRVFDVIPLEYDISNGFDLFQAEYNDELQKIEIRKKLIVIERSNRKSENVDGTNRPGTEKRGDSAEDGDISANLPDSYFRSQNLKYIFALCHMDGGERNKIIGLRNETYDDPVTAKEWYRGVLKMVHPDANPSVKADADKAVMNLNKIYDRIKRSFESDDSEDEEDA